MKYTLKMGETTYVYNSFKEMPKKHKVIWSLMMLFGIPLACVVIPAIVVVAICAAILVSPFCYIFKFKNPFFTYEKTP